MCKVPFEASCRRLRRLAAVCGLCNLMSWKHPTYLLIFLQTIAEPHEASSLSVVGLVQRLAGTLQPLHQGYMVVECTARTCSSDSLQVC